MKYFVYLGTYFSTAQIEPLKTFLQQLYQLIVEMLPQRIHDHTLLSGLPLVSLLRWNSLMTVFCMIRVIVS